MALRVTDRETAVAALLERHRHLPAFDPNLLGRKKAEAISEYGDELEDLGRMVCMPELLGKVASVPIELVHANPHQPREFFDPQKLRELEALILSNGQQHPIDVTVVELPSGVLAFGINDGERRLRVMQGLGAAEILVNVIFIPNADAFHEQSFLTNEGQAEHGPMEKARNYKRMLEARKRKGITDPKQNLADSIGKSVANVDWHLDLLEFPSEIQSLILIDVVNPHGAHQLMDFSRAKEVDILELARQCLGVNDLASVKKAKHRTQFRGVFSRERVEAVAEHMRSGEEGPVDGTQIDVRRKLLAAFDGVGRAKKTLTDLGEMIEDEKLRPVLEAVAKGRGGYPPEKLLEAMQETRAALAVVEQFFSRLTEAPALPDVPGKPTFLERINALVAAGTLVRGTDVAAERQVEVLRLLAQASDKKTLTLTSKEILAALPVALRFPTSIGMSPVFEAIRRAVDPHGIEVDVSEKYERTERGFEKMNAYRLKWKVEVTPVQAAPTSAPAVQKTPFPALPPELTLNDAVLVHFPVRVRSQVEALVKGFAVSESALDEIFDLVDALDEETYGPLKAALLKCVEAQMDAVPVKSAVSAPVPAKPAAPAAPKPVAAPVQKPAEVPSNGDSAFSFFIGKDVGAVIPMVDKWSTLTNQTLNFGQRRALAHLLAAGVVGVEKGDEGLMKACLDLTRIKAGSVVKTKGTYRVTERMAAVIRGANRV